MFTYPLDALIFFTITTPGIGLLAERLDRKGIVEIYSSIGFVVTILLFVNLYSKISVEGIQVILSFGSKLFMESLFVIDSLSVFIVAVFLAIGFFSTLYSIRYMGGGSGHYGYYTLISGMTAGMVGLVFAGDLLTFFIFWEIMCLCSYALVAFNKDSWEPVEAGYKYLIMSGVGSLTVLFAMSIIYGMTGTLNLAFLSQGLSESTRGLWLYLALTMFISGLGLQAGMVPLHTWLPDAHSAAPAPISAILSGAMVMTGVYGLFRLLILLFNPLSGAWQMTLALFALITMSVGNLMALLQDDLKRMLAFSTIANVGYILLGLSTNNIVGLTGALFQILNHALVKSLLFLCTGSFFHQTNSRSLRELEGIGKRMPMSSGLFLLGLISLAGIPPLNMFWSEWTILIGSFRTSILFSILMIANLVISAAYCLRVVQSIYIKGETQISCGAKEVSVSLLIPKLMIGILCLVIGLYASPFRMAAEEAAQAALNIQGYVDALL